jgi:hypothetical protein
VTVCVAAMCADNILIGASDRMLTAGDVEFEPETAKIYSITNSSIVMIAGEASLQIEILQSLYKFAAERIKERAQEWLPIIDIANEYQSIYQDIKSRKAESRVLRPLGLTRDTFIRRQREMSDSIVENLTKEIVNFEMLRSSHPNSARLVPERPPRRAGRNRRERSPATPRPEVLASHGSPRLATIRDEENGRPLNWRRAVNEGGGYKEGAEPRASRRFP